LSFATLISKLNEEPVGSNVDWYNGEARGNVVCDVLCVTLLICANLRVTVTVITVVKKTCSA